MVRIFILLIISFSGRHALSQNPVFDSIYRHTVLETVYTDPPKALKNTDYLFSIASESSDQVKSLLLKSEIFRMSGLTKEAISSLSQADSLVAADNYGQQLLIHGLLATNYRESGQLFFARKHLDESKKIIPKIKDQDERNKLFANILQETAYTDMEEKEYRKAISNIQSSIEYSTRIDSTKTELNLHFALNYQIIGQNYLKLKLPDSSMYYYQKALKQLDKSPSSKSTLKGFILEGIANSAILLGDFENVETYFEEAMAIARNGNNFTLQKNIYSSKIKFFKNQEEHIKYIAANEEYLSLIRNETAQQALARESIYDFLEKKQTGSPEERSSFNWSILWISGATLLVLGILKFNKNRRKPPPSITQILPDKEGNSHHKEVDKEHNSTELKEYLTDDAMDSIIASLKELEAKRFYLDKNVSVASVATEVGVNHRYLSHTINRKYGKDFTTYINDLRIDYIIGFLKENPKHLNYKISYLAERAGFSSHNRFSIIFKKSRGISPSELINDLRGKQENTES